MHRGLNEKLGLSSPDHKQESSNAPSKCSPSGTETGGSFLFLLFCLFLCFSLGDMAEPKKIWVPNRRAQVLNQGFLIAEKALLNRERARSDRNTQILRYTHRLKTTTDDHHTFIHLNRWGNPVTSYWLLALNQWPCWTSPVCPKRCCLNWIYLWRWHSNFVSFWGGDVRLLWSLRQQLIKGSPGDLELRLHSPRTMVLNLPNAVTLWDSFSYCCDPKP